MALSNLNNDVMGDSGSLSEIAQRRGRGKRPSSGLQNSQDEALRAQEAEKSPVPEELPQDGSPRIRR